VFGEREGAGLAEALRRLNARIGLPTGLAAMGIEPRHHAVAAVHALLDHCHGTNPRVATRDEYLTLLEASA
jgi:alcohol dehydrogenase class IV